MGLITKIYQKNFLQRYDKDEAIPYYSPADFPGLECIEGSFVNSEGVTIRYFTYCYAEPSTGKLILFCPGMGPGHTAYLAEIETLCRAGYRVLTLDYTGCGASGGERMTSVNAPTRDALELIDLLKPQEELVPVGHSLGGYTALNIARLLPAVKHAVIISGFVTISDEMMGFVKLRLLADRVKRFEKKLDPQYGAGDNRAYIAATQDKLLWIHSTDDPMVNYKHNAGRVLKAGNPNIRVLTVEHKRHNPQYTQEALATMNAWMGGYYRLIREKQLETPEARKAYFADKPVGQMTAQDPAVFGEILKFLN
ncbi:MAG: alpha/beta fold hydrolase [Clostridia bacterium]|nr:alpha/beta fold hydrolase [Clostridia bacterium]